MRSVALLSALVALSGCATGPTRNFVKSSHDLDKKIASIHRIALVADSAVLVDSSSAKYWSIKDSSSSGEYMLSAASAYLEKRGFEVVSSEAPLIGGFKDSSVAVKVAQERDAKISESHFPLSAKETVDARSDSSRQLAAAATGVFGSFRQRAPASCCAGANVRPGVDAIAKGGNADAVLFLLGNGTWVSSGKSVAQGVVTGILTTVLTLGMVTYAQWDVSYLDTAAALVDARTGEVLWSNNLRHKESPIDKDFYAEKWPSEMLFHLPTRAPASAS